MRQLFSNILKYKVLHVAYWIWAVIDLWHEQRFYKGGVHTDDVVFSILGQMLSVYSVIYFLIPRYFNRQKYLQFVLFAILSVIFFSFLTIELNNLYLSIFRHVHLIHVLILLLTHCVSSVIVATVFTAVVMVASMFQTEIRNRQLEKEKLQTELNFLKSQINPHLLFNALNNIYVLIDVDKKVAKDTLLKFSDLLRYQLYECKRNLVEVRRELSFINDYIEIEKLRCADNIYIEFKVPKQIIHFQIAPFVLIPLIENAFKHVSRHKDKADNFIEIEVMIDEERFSFVISNTYEERSVIVNSIGGIGLQNVKRRLELLYPGTHSIIIDKKDGIFTVNLLIHANNNELPHS
jgi:two-component system LytT family sensor kinase